MDINIVPSTLSFTERYNEYLHLGYPDWQIAKKMGLPNESLYRQLCRHNIPARPELQRMIRGDEIARSQNGRER